jgi:HTH-type transcriptional regulator/antitoxin HigA
MMDAILVLIDSDAELFRARALVDQLWNSNDPADVARLGAQARLIAAYEEMKWPRRPPSVADLIRRLMDQHGLTRADLIPLLGTPSRVSEVMRGKRGLAWRWCSACAPFPCAGRFAPSAAEEVAAQAFREASGGLPRGWRRSRERPQ